MVIGRAELGDSKANRLSIRGRMVIGRANPENGTRISFADLKGSVSLGRAI